MTTDTAGRGVWFAGDDGMSPLTQQRQAQTGASQLMPMGDSEFSAFLAGSDVVLEKYPFYPIGSPELPPPGPNFLVRAQRSINYNPDLRPGEDPQMDAALNRHLTYLYLRAMYDKGFTLPVQLSEREEVAHLVPGHLRDYDVCGPMPSTVMVIGKHPGKEELQVKRNMVGGSSNVFWESCLNAGFTEEEMGNWYLTCMVKWNNLDPNSSKLKPAWQRDCGLILQQELRFVRPDYILCLGSEASNFLLAQNCGVTSKGSGFGTEAMKGRAVPINIPLHDQGEMPNYHVAQVMTCIHPNAVLRSPEKTDELEVSVGQFRALTQGSQVGGLEPDVDHRVIYTGRELEAVVDMVLREAETDPRANIIAVDAEWQGERPDDPTSYLRSVQFSHRPKFSATIVLREPGGGQAFKPGDEAAAVQLRRLLCRTESRIGGHFFRADLPWIRHKLKIDLRPYYKPPTTWEATSVQGGWDTSLMAHATNETQRLKLEELCVRIGMPRWDVELAKWRRAEAHRLKADDEKMLGYGDCPSNILHPTEWECKKLNRHNYAGYDADGTRRLFDSLDRLLDKDGHGNNSRRAYWTSHSASLACLEMEETGLMLHRVRTEEMIRIFELGQATLLQHLRQMIRWQNFNPNSTNDKKAFLFGSDFGLNKAGVSSMPEDAVSLNLIPIMTTGKRGKAWADIVERGETHLHNPSTNGETLGILGHQDDRARILRDIMFIGQVLKTILKPAVRDKRGIAETDEDGLRIYEKGLLSHADFDGRVHTRIGQCLETGRYNSYDPNLQNIPKRREGEYSRILGANPEHCDYTDIMSGDYTRPIRSVFMAAPGHVFIEADYTGAELAGIMWLANDPAGIDHVRRNILPESHPDHYDIHSRQAVRAFGLDCDPTKTGLKNSGNKGLRIAAKNVNFGIPYGRGGEAIARQCREEGVDISARDADQLIAMYFEQYPHTYDFLEACKARVHDPRWVSNAFGRLRRFRWSNERSVIGEQERQAMNFPIQSLVADAVSRALDHLYHYRDDFDPSVLDYRIALQIHDAVLLEVPIQHVPRVVDEVMPTCMVGNVPITPCDLDGNPMQVEEPYRFGIDVEVQQYWGVDMTEEEAVAIGLDPSYV